MPKPLIAMTVSETAKAVLRVSEGIFVAPVAINIALGLPLDNKQQDNDSKNMSLIRHRN